VEVLGYLTTERLTRVTLTPPLAAEPPNANWRTQRTSRKHLMGPFKPMSHAALVCGHGAVLILVFCASESATHTGTLR